MENKMIRLICSEATARTHSYEKRTGEVVETEAYKVRGYIETEKLEGKKSVIVRSSCNNWEPAYANFLESLSPTKELWEFSIGNYNPYDIKKDFGSYSNNFIPGYKLTLRFRAGEQEFLDDNNSEKYESAYGGEIDERKVILISHHWGIILAKDFGSERQVKVLYTYDGWETVKTIEADYMKPFFGTGASLWSYDIPEVSAPLELSVSYTVDNEKFWDNDDGRNHKF
ncbi:MAG: hypothetical protein GY754_13515 [bacterium]|nr:hypothetical protein [bacterium]